VYVGANDGKVYAFNAATGANLWTSALLTNAGGFIQGGPAVQLKTYSDGSYPHAFDLVVVGTRNLSDTATNKIYGLNGNTGAVVWTYAPTNLDIINSTPWIDYNTNAAWVTSNATSGQPSIWKMDTRALGPAGVNLAQITLSTTNKHIDTSPTLNEGAAAATFLYAVTKGNDLVAVDINPSSNAAYTTNVSGAATGGAGFPIPIVDGTTLNWDDIYFTLSGGSGGVYKRRFDRLNKTFGGACSSPNCWDRTLAGASTPIFTPGGSLAIYVGATDGKIYSLKPADGTNAATPLTAATSGTTGDPSFDVVTNKIYIGATDGRIYSFDKF
jgi:outer membrane protein assembly factor BamB